MLPGRVALVTGAASGLGRAIAIRLAAEGARVGLADINHAGAQATAQAIEASNGEAFVRRTDVTRWDDVQAAVRAVLERWGQLDVMVNNAGVNVKEPLLEMTESGFDQTLDVNLTGVFYGLRAAAVPMKAARSGCIINMSSMREESAREGSLAYCASKGGVRMLTRAAAVELGAHRIRVCALGPGFTQTPLLAALYQDPEARQHLLSRIPLGRFGNAEEMAAAVAFLASDDASYVTGTTLIADGGELTH